MEALQDVREAGGMTFGASNISEDGDEEDLPLVSADVTPQSTDSN